MPEKFTQLIDGNRKCEITRVANGYIVEDKHGNSFIFTDFNGAANAIDRMLEGENPLAL